MNKKLILGLIIFFTLATALVSATTNDAIAYYSFDDEGNYTIDQTGPIGAAGKLETGINYTANADWSVTANDPDNIQTISAWVKLDDNTTDTVRVIAEQRATNGWYFQIDNPSTNMALHIIDDDGVSNHCRSTTLNWNQSQWYHVAFVKNNTDGASGYFYRDGVLLSNGACALTTDTYLDNQGTDLYIGNYDIGSAQIRGTIDDIALWTNDLNQTHITALYNSGTGAKANTVDTANIAFYNDMDSLNDESTNTYYATGKAGVTLTDTDDGKINTAYDFDGTDDYINIDNTLTDLANDTTGTISFWINPTDATPLTLERIINFGDTSANEYISVYLNTDGTLYFFAKDAGVNQWRVSTDAAELSDGVWSYITLVQDGIEPEIWINGTQPAQTFDISTDKTDWFADLTGIDNGRIGDWNNNAGGESGHFTGEIDEVAFYSRNLSTSEIGTLYNSGTGYNPYSTAANLTVTITDVWDSSNVDNITVTINGTTYTNTTGNTVTTHILTDNVTLWDINLTANNYINKDYPNYNASASGQLAATMYQANISIQPQQLYSTTNLTGCNCTISTTTASCLSQWYINASSAHSTLVNCTGDYYDLTQNINVTALDNDVKTITGLYNLNLSVRLNATPYQTSVLNGTGWLYHNTIAYNYTGITTATQPIIIPWIQGNWTYYFQAEIDGIAGYTKNTTGTEINNSAAHNTTYELANDYLQLQFINNTEGAQVTYGRIVFQDADNYTTLFNNTSFISLQSDFPIGYVNVYFNDADAWQQRYVYYNDKQTIYNDTIQILELNDTSTWLRIEDQNGQPVDLAKVRLYHSDASIGSYNEAKLIGQLYTNTNGKAFFKSDSDKPVWVIIVKDGYAQKAEIIETNLITSTEASPYIIKLSEELTGYSDNVLVHHTPMYDDTTTINISINAFDKDTVILNVNGSNYTLTENIFSTYKKTLTNGTHYTTGTAFNYSVYIDGTLHNTYTVNLETELTNELLNNITFPKIGVVLIALLLTLGIGIVFRAEGVGFTTFTILGAFMVIMNSAFWLVSTLLLAYYGVRWVSKLVSNN